MSPGEGKPTWCKPAMHSCPCSTPQSVGRMPELLLSCYPGFHTARLLSAPQTKGLTPVFSLCRLKVHYRAPPNARGSGVERGHGMELPFCPLCNLDLRDVKYHKCAAGPAAAAPVSCLRCLRLVAVYSTTHR